MKLNLIIKIVNVDKINIGILKCIWWQYNFLIIKMLIFVSYNIDYW